MRQVHVVKQHIHPSGANLCVVRQHGVGHVLDHQQHGRLSVHEQLREQHVRVSGPGPIPCIHTYAHTSRQSPLRARPYTSGGHLNPASTRTQAPCVPPRVHRPSPTGARECKCPPGHYYRPPQQCEVCPQGTYADTYNVSVRASVSR
jgi:hypothetical protein